MSGVDKNEFKKWVFKWDKRVFKQKLRMPKELHDFLNPAQCQVIAEHVDSYHQEDGLVGHDRFVWYTFTSIILKDHQREAQQDNHTPERCQTNKYLYILLWISYYLRLPYTRQVEEILLEISTCTKNLRFMFSFLPGMSIQLYASTLLCNPPLFEDKLCHEYFKQVEGSNSSIEVFKHSQSFLLYLVEHFTPLHSRKNFSSVTLGDVINKEILPGKKYSLLTFAIQNNDDALVKLLLELGASADMHYWDHLMGSKTTAERIMITSINSIVGSRQFLFSLNISFEEIMQYMETLVTTVSSYAPLIRRSVFQSEQRKSNNIWSSEDSTHELNREVADEWGIGYERPWPSLQHMCKLAIRQTILKADKVLLPSGIALLPLPYKVKKYLNLEFD